MTRRLIATFAAGLALLACTRNGTGLLGGIAEGKEQRVAVDVKSSDDLANVYLQYLALVDAGKDALLEVNLLPGEYGKASFGPISLDLEPAAGKSSRVDVVLRGTGAGVVLANMAATVTARSLRLENLVFTRNLGTLLKVKVQKALALKNVTVIGNQQGAPFPQNLIDVMGTAGAGAYTVDVQDSWFIGNSEASQSALLAIQMADGAFVERVTFDRVGFVDNAFTTDVAILGAKDIRVSNCLVYDKRQPRAPGVVPTFLQYSTPHSARIEGSILVTNQLDYVAGEQLLGGASVPVEVTGSHLYLLQGGAATAQSTRLRLKGSTVQDLSLAGREKAVADAVAALSGARPPGEWSGLLAALGIKK